MSISEMQACGARLYVDECFRKLFFLDPDEATREYRLTNEELLALKSIDRRRLNFFAASLRNKRKERLVRSYPILFALHGQAIERYYRRYYQLCIAQPYHDEHQDVLDFGRFAEDSVADAEDLPLYVSDLVRYERLCYWTNIDRSVADGKGAPAPVVIGCVRKEDRLRQGRGVRVESFAYDVPALEPEAQTPCPSRGEADLQPGQYFIAFKPASPPFGPRMLRINNATRALIEQCDGIRSATDIVREVEALFGAADLEPVLFEAIDRLTGVGVIEIDRG